MKSLEELSALLSQNKELLHQKYGVCELGIFGSFSRKEQKSSSDLDILVDFDRPVGMEFIELAEELETLLGIKVDLVSKNGIKPKYLNSVKEDLIYV